MQVPPSSFTKYAVNLMFEESAQHQIQDFNWQSDDMIQDVLQAQNQENLEIELQIKNEAKENRPIQQPKPLLKYRKISKKRLKFVTEKDFCKCQKSQCQKSYCECFAAGRPCSEKCGCIECGNIHFRVTKEKEQLGCNCRKTNCLKRYCECYLKGKQCTFLCNCQNCYNQDDASSSSCDHDQQSPSANNNKSCDQIGKLGSDLFENQTVIEQINRIMKEQ